ncbi:NAD(P)-binding protein [Aspergillus uvarum CBS 121591]|uniref:NAD(P)-binding protein n=1 Tax=Aspergillus uvarum CBS 121591 TaxID=1448315 RepID=A0A319E8B6_9EURO|nr:NAD(P)-binding protein [Aspergillus uvarum CBS 121591]PYH87322.1 NAD(P)-binding protein [Aspergillus uvarum CBS 121591]
MVTNIRNVIVIGASGNVGRSSIKALQAEGFEVTGLTRESSDSILPANVRHIKSDFSQPSLQEAFRGQDAVVSAVSSIIPGDALAQQKSFIDAALAAGVKIFIPSEYGVDTGEIPSPDFIPFLVDKRHAVDYLKQHQERMSWTAVISGGMFDWGLNIPGFGGWDLPARKVTIFDDGDIPFEATSLDQVGRAIAKCLKKPDLTMNNYIYVNSFTITQNQVLKTVEKITNEKFTVMKDSVDDLWTSGASKWKEGQPLGVLAMIAGTVYGQGNLNHFSVTKGLWNERLDLQQEDLEVFLRDYLAKK